MDPRVSAFQTFLAAVCARFHILDFFNVWASFQHRHCVLLGTDCRFTTPREESAPSCSAALFLNLVDAIPAPTDSLAQTLWAADEGTAAFVETAQAVNVAGDSNSDRGADWARGPNRGTEPQFAARA